MRITIRGALLLSIGASAAACEVGDGGLSEPEVAVAESKLVRHEKAVPNRYIVVLDRIEASALRSPKAIDSFAEEHGAVVLQRYENALNGFAAEMTESDARAMAADRRVRFIEEDQPVTFNATQLNATWGIDRVDQFALPLDTTYTYNNNGTGVHVYVIDTGIRATHTQFGGRVTTVFSAINDGNGGNDCQGHGTHVAGTIGGSVYGMAKNVQLHNVRIAGCPGTGSGTWGDIIAGIDWVTANRILPAVANMSFSGNGSMAVDNAVTAAINAGVTVVTAAGNGSRSACLESPGRVPAAINVGSVDNTDTMEWTSAYGPCVDLFAPGVNISSAFHFSDWTIVELSGTSPAAAHVTGAAALYLSANPGATPAEVSAALIGQASIGRVNSAGAGSPNRLLYTRCIGSPDLVAPTVTVTAPADGASVAETVSIAASAADETQLGRVDFYLGTTLLSSDTSAPYSASFNSRDFANGAHTITARAVDLGCNETSSPVSITIDNYVDVTPPSVSITSPAEGATVSGEVVIQASASDDVSVARVDFYMGTTLLGSDTTAPYSFTWSTGVVFDGPYALTARGVDTVNNVGTSAAVNVTVDNPGDATFDPTLRAPACLVAGARCDSSTLVLGRGTVGPEPNQPNTVNNSCADGNSGVFHESPSVDRISVTSVDGSPFASGTPVRVEVTIWSANTSDYLEIFYATNVNAPVWRMIGVSQFGIAPGRFVQTVPITLQGGALQGIRARLGSWALQPQCAPGAAVDHDDLIFSVINAGDTTPPTVTITSPAAPFYVRNTVTFAANAFDDVAVREVQFFDGTTLLGVDTTAPYSIQWDTTTIPGGGNRSLTARAIDTSNNATTSLTTSVYVDNNPPATAWVVPVAGSMVRGTYFLGATAFDDSGVQRVEFYLGASLIGTDTVSPYDTAWNTTGLEGSYTLSARAFDILGNQATSDPVTVIVDNVVPSVSVTAPSNGTTVAGSVTINANASDNRQVQRVEFLVDSTLLGSDTTAPYSYTWSSGSVPNGPHTLSARSFDVAGNSTTNTVNITVNNSSFGSSFNSTLQAPWCASPVARCDTGALTNGRASVGPEPNQPNTINDSCLDGTGGTYHTSTSIDRMVVSTTGGAPFATGSRVRVEMLIWATASFANERLDIFHAPDANNPTWTLLTTITPPGSGARITSYEFNLPAGSLQAVRGSFRSGGSAVPCSTGSTDDMDDLIISVAP